MTEEWISVPCIGRKKLNKGEQIVLGGFFSKGPYVPSDIHLLQYQVPLGIQRAAKAFNKDVKIDLNLEDVLKPSGGTGTVAGFLTKKDISNKWGTGIAVHVGYGDAIIILDRCTIVVEIKTSGQTIEGVNDIYEGFGQIIFNRERFKEDYPLIAEEKNVKALLLTEASKIDIELIKKPFIENKVGFFDPTRGGFLIDF